MKAAKKKAQHGGKGNQNAAKPVKRDLVIKFRVTAIEEAAYKKQAKDSGITLSAWIVSRLPVFTVSLRKEKKD